VNNLSVPQTLLLGGVAAATGSLCFAILMGEPGDPAGWRLVLAFVTLGAGGGAAYCTVSAISRAVKTLQQLMVMSLFLTAIIGMSAFDRISSFHTGQRFEREGREALATVLERRPYDHDRISVSYSVNGKEYRALVGTERVARSYVPGERVNVYYFASEPDWARGQRPEIIRPPLTPIYLRIAILAGAWFAMWAAAFHWWIDEAKIVAWEQRQALLVAEMRRRR
jgi:hypothetical protein